MPTAGTIKPGFVHIRAFSTSPATSFVPPTPVSSPGLTWRSSTPRRWLEPKGKGRGVLDTPLSRSMTVSGEGREPRPHAFFFTSLMLENVMPSARSLV
jgi:hypothetical protein